MKKLIIALSIISNLIPAAFALPTVHHSIDASYGLGDEKFITSFSWKPMLGFLDNDRLKVGIGLRYSGFVGDTSVEYKRVDSAYSGTSSYELLINDPRASSFNTVFESTFDVWQGFEIGLNIDLFGAGFGKARTGNYVSPSAQAGAQVADVPNFNLLLFGKHDKGQLNSEFFVGYRCKNRLGIRAGFSHLITEATSRGPLDGEDRYRHLGNFWFVSVGYLI
ncbi:MAG: hypothetical protein KDD48_00680 [Bdellovibrionales bacterium]|nr:hypothetical protein [Bdellovibrionales bacterium]